MANGCFSRRSLLTVAALLIGVIGCKAGAQSSASDSASSLTYEAEFEATNGPLMKAYHLLYDRGRYRVEYNMGGKAADGAATLNDHVVRVYDGVPADGIWEIMPGGGAMPDITTIQHAYYVLAQKEGEEAVKRRYHIVGDSHFMKNIAHASYTRLAARASVDSAGSLSLHKTGMDTIAGYVCERYEWRSEPQPGPDAALNPSSASVYELKVWVEPKTQLVLKSEGRRLFPGTRLPPMRHVVEVHKLIFLQSVPPSQFQLPSGTRVTLPEVLKDTSLPSGVIRYIQDSATGKVTRVSK